MRGYRNKQRCWHLPEYAAQRRSGVARGAARRAHCQLEGEGGRRRTRGLREMARCRPARFTCAVALALSLLAASARARPLAGQLVPRLALHEQDHANARWNQAITPAAGAAAAPLQAAPPRPSPDKAALFARWLVHASTYGALATTSQHLGGKAFANIVSMSDGALDNSTGKLWFYLTEMDPTGSDLSVEPYATLALSEDPVGTCTADPEDPTCGKVMLSGDVNKLDASSAEGQAATAGLFARHPEMKDWPTGHGFSAYEMKIETIFLLNFYGGAKDVKPADYYAAELISHDVAE